ncbi:MAG: ABC transporter permease [Anaerolineae bacterium]|nr:ABC transporter permease [Anaerolineae bacterium]
MTYDLALAWRNLRAHPVQSLIPMIVMALAIGLSITVLALSDGAKRGIVQASDPFGVLVVGPKGDGQQLVLNTILLQGAPLGTIPPEIYDNLAADPRVSLAVPLAKGDNIGGAPIIGTNANFFELRTSVNAPPAFQIGDGAVFTDDFQVVLGSRAAQDLGLHTGDSFRAAHGVGAGLEEDVHEQIFTVVGILKPGGTAYDGAAYTTAESVWHVHEHEEGEEHAEGEEGEHEEGEEHEETGLTAILVQPVGFAEANQIWQDFYTDTTAQAVFPGQELGGLFDLLNQGVQILTVVGYLVLGIAALTVFLSMYNSTISRERDIAIMRSVGGSRVNVFRVVLFETLALTIFGALLGRLLGYGMAAIIGTVITQRSAIPLPIAYLVNLEPLLWLLPIGVGVLAGLIPAGLAYRVDVVEKLSPT